MSGAYYNEYYPFAAQWIRNLIRAGLIADGDVDERDIKEVQPDDLRGYTQCHFFAGIGGWSYALRLAGWPDDRPVWTGSPPCQPFSTAGKQKGQDDERHLAPVWLRLIGECRPPTIFGEQVSAAVGFGWLDDVFLQLEALGYACGAADFPACGVGAPHIRQRIYFVGHATPVVCADLKALGDSNFERCHGERVLLFTQEGRHVHDLPEASWAGRSGIMGHADGEGLEGLAWHGAEAKRRKVADRSPVAAGAADRGLVKGFWSGAHWVWCRDTAFRPIEPGTFPLADGVPSRVGRLRAYGDAVVPQAAAVFVRAFMEALEAL